MRLLILAAVLGCSAGIAAAAPGGVTGGYLDGVRLLAECAPANPEQSCLGYVAAVSDLHDILVAARVSPRMWCLPETTALGELAAAVHGFVSAHLQLQGNTAADLVARALSTTYACP